MNTINIETPGNDSQCCIDYCKNAFSTSSEEVVNSYKCNQKKLSSSDMWNIQKQKRFFNNQYGN
ncbi:MAG: hypothetical protein ACXVLT_07375 [Flavisolibacter sp.]